MDILDLRDIHYSVKPRIYLRILSDPVVLKGHDLGQLTRSDEIRNSEVLADEPLLVKVQKPEILHEFERRV